MEPLRAISVVGARLYFLPVRMRIPLCFGGQETFEVDCARVRITVRAANGRTAVGWGECPLSVAWAWPSSTPAAGRRAALRAFCVAIASAWEAFGETGSALGLGYGFIEGVLPGLLSDFNAARTARGEEAMPRLAALLCEAAFDMALHDAFGILHAASSFVLLNPEYLEKDLAGFFWESGGSPFSGRFPADYLSTPAPDGLLAWHLVGIGDPLDEGDHLPCGTMPRDGHPVLLRDWIRRDGLLCLKIKLAGRNPEEDFDRIVRVGKLARQENVLHLGVDFNCCLNETAALGEILDRLESDHPELFRMLAFVEQPFGRDLENHPLDVRTLAARKPLILDESAEDWRVVDRGLALGWSGLALKTCKTLTGAILSLCRAKGRGMSVMAQDLTNPMLALIAHANFASHTGCKLGFETNSMQFYPDASLPEAAVHPGIFRRSGGKISLGSLGTTGLGYRIGEIARVLPEPAYGES